MRAPRRWLAGTAMCLAAGLVLLPEDRRHNAALAWRAGWRTSRAFWTLGRVGADYKWSLWRVGPDSEQYAQRLAECHQRAADRLLALCLANGGTYVKMGQMIVAARPVAPKPFTDTLRALLDQGQASSLAEVRRVVEADLGRPLEEVFADFDPRPVGCASLAQVHRATLRATGRGVAVKVQHERLQRDAPADLWTLRQAIHLLEFSFQGLRLQWFYPLAADNLRQELDFRHEAENAERCARNFQPNPQVVLPAVHLALTARHVLTMDFVDAPRIDDRPALRALGVVPRDAAALVVDVFAEMMFVHGFVHCDPHPGNLLVRWSPGGPRRLQLVLLDHGMYRVMDPAFRLAYCKMWKAMILRDRPALQEACGAMGVGAYAELFPLALTGRPISSRTPLGQRVNMQEVRKARQAAGFKERSFAGLSEFMERLPEDLLFMFRTKGMIRALSHDLDASSADRFRAYAMKAAAGLGAAPAVAAARGPSGWLRWGRQRLDVLAFSARVSVVEWGLRGWQWWRGWTGPPPLPSETGPVGH
eukprot:EG_transcript_8676